MSAAATSECKGSYGQHRDATPVDRFGVWLSSRAVTRHASFSGQRFADLGCGFEATFARTQFDACASALLTDLALAPDLAQHPKVRTLEGTLPDVLAGETSGTLDIVLCLSVLEHLPEPGGALAEIHRLLAPGGVAVLNVPSWWGKVALETAAFRLGVAPAEEMDDHKAYYDPRDLWPLLVRAGFRPRNIRCHRHKFGLNTLAVCRVPRGTA